MSPSSTAWARRSASDRGRLGLEGEVGKDVAHQGLVHQPRAEGGAVPRVVQGAHEGLTHGGGRAEDAVEPGGGDHVDDGAHAAALVADPHTPRAVELDLGGRVGAVAELVLEALQRKGIAGAVVEDARDEEAGGAGVGLGEDEEGVAHRGGAEPLVPGQPVGVPAAERAALRAHRASGVGSHVGAALLLGHAHAGDGAALVGDGTQAEVVLAGGELGDPARRELGVGAERGHGGIRHRHRAQVPGLDLGPHDEPSRAAHVGAGAAAARSTGWR